MNTPEQEYNAYHSTMFPDANESPHLQGLSPDGYSRALQDTGTVIQTVDTLCGEARVPQIVDIDTSEWHNPEFYRKKYGQDGRIAIVGFTDGVDFSESTELRLGEMADDGGVLAFDAPFKVGDDCCGRLVKRLSRLGIAGDVKLLGTQTYFEGQIRYNAEESEGIRSSGVPPKGITDTFQRIVRPAASDMLSDLDEDSVNLVKSTLVDDDSTGVWLYDKVPDELARVLYDFYDEAYEVLNDSPVRQGLHPGLFSEMARNDTVASKLVYSRNDKPETLMISTTDIERLEWVNSDFYKNKYPEQYDGRELLWIPGVATDPGASSLRNSQKIVSMMVNLGGAEGFNPRLLFDFGDFNVSLGLHKAIEAWVARTRKATVQFNEIASQQYFGLKLSKTP